MSDYNNLLTLAENAIAKHNGAIETFAPGASDSAVVSFQKFREGLIKLGGTTAEALRLARIEDLEELGAPKLLARQLAEIFRAPQSKVDTQAPRRKALRPREVANMTLPELVSAYDPAFPTNAVASRLREVSGDRAFILFNKQGEIDRTVTSILLEELVDGEIPRDSYAVGEDTLPLYKVGQKPNDTRDEHPLFRGESLRKDGTDKNGLAWINIPFPIRQLIRLASDTLEITVRQDDRQRIVETFELAKRTDAKAALTARYPKAALRFTELERNSDLPKLKVVPRYEARLVQSLGQNDPFHGASTGKRAY